MHGNNNNNIFGVKSEPAQLWRVCSWKHLGHGKVKIFLNSIVNPCCVIYIFTVCSTSLYCLIGFSLCIYDVKAYAMNSSHM